MGNERKLTVGSLFAGIGLFELGLEMTGGFETKWQVEIDPYANKVLEKHWPNVTRWDDVKTFPPPATSTWLMHQWNVDVVIGGFPCQDISTAGKGEGLAGEKSGLWYEYARIIRTIRPRYVIVENVGALVTRNGGSWFGGVLGALVSLGYDSEWHCIPASAVGALHSRDRVWITAYANDNGELHSPINAKAQVLPEVREDVWGWSRFAERCGVHDRKSTRLDRLRCLGNAVVPQVAELIGNNLLESIKQAKQ